MGRRLYDSSGIGPIWDGGERVSDGNDALQRVSDGNVSTADLLSSQAELLERARVARSANVVVGRPLVRVFRREQWFWFVLVVTPVLFWVVAHQ